MALDDQFDAASGSTRIAVSILVRGHVQGVGFRPYVFRLANECRLAGSVGNRSDGVAIELEGDTDQISLFQGRLHRELPAGAAIDSQVVSTIASKGRRSFVINTSVTAPGLQVRIPRDAATCTDCRREIFDPTNRRHGYPFTNCTSCGPRYSIIETMPYDRPSTAMRRFHQCSTCTDEYVSPGNRRFHAQPNACADCGPSLELWNYEGQLIASRADAIVATVQLLRDGQIVGVKGLGGFQLLVRADDDGAVARLRARKHRPSKPLAVMAPSIASAESIAEINDIERQTLQSARNPIVLLKRKPTETVCGSVAPHMRALGVLLPTTPLHHLLLAEFGAPLVATSGNVSDEPIVIDEQEAVTKLNGVADAYLVHDRPIVRRVDDSVVHVMANRAVTLRLARGDAPHPLPCVEKLSGPPILAVGGHQCSALALWTGSQAVLTQHLGDLDHADTRAAFAGAAKDLCRLFSCNPGAIACDQHPDYFSTRWADRQSVPVIRVQHHHAHAVAGMVEHGLLGEEVLAITWDGTGFGNDGTIWGGEFLKARIDGFERVASLCPLPLPGGEAAIRHPNRIAFGMLHQLMGADTLLAESHWLMRLGIKPHEARLLSDMIQRGIQTPWASSIGRLFDGVAAIVLAVRSVTYEGEAAMRLEAVIDPAVDDAYDLPSNIADSRLPCPGGDWRPLVVQLLADIAADTDVGVMAAKFHNGLVRWAVDVAACHAKLPVVLGGGCFQNRFLTTRIVAELKAKGRQVFPPGEIPPGDGGLAAGQLAIASAMSRKGR